MSGKESSVAYGSASYYGLCGVGGMLSCGLTHTLVTPIDMVKCRIQIDPKKYMNLKHGLKTTIQEEGFAAISKGYAPTFIGYSLQGLGKFGFYELFKNLYSSALSQETASQYRTAIYLASSASAEFFADIMLCPMETVKVKMQTNADFPKSFNQSYNMIVKNEGRGALLKRRVLVSLWGRQIPYTMMKFSCFERTVESIYKYYIKKDRDECSKPTRLGVTVVSGYIAGIFCAIVSHPSDVLVSIFNKDKNSKLNEIIKRLGFKGLWKGLGSRVLMIGTLTSAQWLVYDSWKTILNLPSPSLADKK